MSYHALFAFELPILNRVVANENYFYINSHWPTVDPPPPPSDDDAPPVEDPPPPAPIDDWIPLLIIVGLGYVGYVLTRKNKKTI